jgi:hypothetical protein
MAIIEKIEIITTISVTSPIWFKDAQRLIFSVVRKFIGEYLG